MNHLKELNDWKQTCKGFSYTISKKQSHLLSYNNLMIKGLWMEQIMRVYINPPEKVRSNIPRKIYNQSNVKT